MNSLTENNHESMATVVETFIIEETQELIYDNEKLDKWNSLVEELGLSGQTKIAAPEKSPIPFMHMKDSLKAIFKVLCPREVSIKDYDKTPIPVEILNLVALSTKEQYFNDIQIWYDDKNPDPICVGQVGYWFESDWYTDSNKELKGLKFGYKKEIEESGGKHPNFNSTTLYLIGKWGDVKHSFGKLKEMAKTRFMENRSCELQRTIKNAKRELDDLELEATEKFK